MIDPIVQNALDAVFYLDGVGGVMTPKSGSGPVACTALVLPLPDDEVATLLGIAGSERPAFSLEFRTSELLQKPVRGDRFTADGGETYQLRGVEGDAFGASWLCTGSVVLPDVGVGTDGWTLPFYLGGIEELGV